MMKFFGQIRGGKGASGACMGLDLGSNPDHNPALTKVCTL